MVDRLVAVDDSNYKLPEPVLATLGADMADPATTIGAQLNDTIAAAVPGRAGILPGAAADLIASRLAFGVGDVTVGIASDSTSDGPTDWVRLWLAHLAPRFPRLRIENNQWVNANGAYGPTTIVQEGEGEPAFSGDILHDTFTRTTNLATPDAGDPWEVLNPSSWGLDGQKVTATGTARLRADTGSRDFTSTTVIDLDSTGTGAAQNFRVYHGATYGMFVQVTVNGGGLATAYLYRIINGAATEVTNQRLDLAVGVPVNANAGPLTVTIQGAIQNYAVTIGYGAQSWSHQFSITEAAYSAMETKFALYPQTAAPGLGASEVTVNVVDRPPTYQTLRVWSGTMGGGTMQYQMDNWDAMFGSEVGAATTSDLFARTGQVAGSFTTGGQVWSGSALWTTDGTAAVASGAGSVNFAVTDAQSVSANTEVVTTAPAAAQTLRFGLHAVGDGVNGLYVGLGISTSGAFTASTYVRTTSGGFRDLGPVAGHGITASTATAQTVHVEASIDGLNVAVSVGAGSANYTITQAEADQLGDRVEMQAASTSLDQFRVLDVSATYGAAGAGGDPLDVMVLAHGHNYGSMGPDAFIGKVEEFLAFMGDRRPSTLPLISSENPQFSPSANPPAHAARLLALRGFAQQNGFSYAPVFEHFAGQSDGGQSWVLADGVHPTAPSLPLPSAGYGMSEWGKVLAATVTL